MAGAFCIDHGLGAGKDVADIMEEWFSTRACDGFVIAATHVPGAYEDFVKYVVPELQKRVFFIRITKEQHFGIIWV